MDQSNSPSKFKPSANFKSPFSTPPSTYGSPDFKPYNYSSPEKHVFTNRGKQRYFTYSNRSFHSPRQRGSYHNWRDRSRRQFDTSDISIYANNSMTEDPWAHLEQILQEKGTKIKEDSDTTANSQEPSLDKSDDFDNSVESSDKTKDSIDEISKSSDKEESNDILPSRPD